MYSLSQTKGTTKILLQSGRQDYGTTDNPSFVLNEVVQAPPFSFGLIGLEKMYWRQPYVFPTQYLNLTLTSQTLSGTNTPGSMTLTATDFIRSVTLNNTTQTTNLADMYYDGSGGEFLARMLECFRLTIASALQSLLGGGGGTYTCDFSSSTFASWNALSSVPSTPSTLSKMDAATGLLRHNYMGLNLIIGQTSGDIMGVTFSDTLYNGGLVSRILNVASGSFNIATTPGTYGGTVWTNTEPIFINFEGLHYIKMRCSASMGCKEAHILLPGVQPTSLLALIPSTGTPGTLEYYEPLTPSDRITVKDFTMDQITLQFLDYADRPLTTLPEFAAMITIDFMAREEETPSVNVMRH